MIISDNLKTWLRFFELSHGANMMNITSKAGNGVLFSCQRQASTCVECTSVLIDFFRQHNVLSLIYLHSVIFLSLFWLFYKTPRHNQYFNSFMLCLFHVVNFFLHTGHQCFTFTMFIILFRKQVFQIG